MPIGIEERDARSAAVGSRLAVGGGRVHLIGVGGVGMAGLAWWLKQRGFSVEGCDVDAGAPTVHWLRSQGVQFFEGHDPSHISEGIDWVIRSNAIAEDAAEVVAARANGVPVDVRGEVLPHLLEGVPSIAVGGTHGKTTTATLCAHLLRRGLGEEVGWCIGAQSELVGAVAGGGTQGPMVVEADESDGTLALYAPQIAVVTNVEFDHMEHFSGEEAFRDCFRRFVGQASRVVYCADDAGASRLCSGFACAYGYGLAGGDLQMRGTVVSEGVGWQEVEVYWEGAFWGRFRLPFTGRHNVRNALAACVVAQLHGVSGEAACRALEEARLPARRFEVVAEAGGVRVVSDYAHHPTEIAAALEMGRDAVVGGGRLKVLFQPHRYTRTRALLNDFPEALKGADEVILVPVYPASEAPLKGGRIEDLYEACRRAGVPELSLCEELDDGWEALVAGSCAGDVLMLLGAGSIGALAGLAQRAAAVGALPGYARADAQASRAPVPVAAHARLGVRTTYGVGGEADLWCRVDSVEALSEVRRWAAQEGLRETFLGAGSNVLVPDTGVRGLVVRLGDAFRGMAREGDVLLVGGGCSIAALVDAARRYGAAGYSRLAGIPGGVGGAVSMNAGAHGVCMADLVLWVEGVDVEGRLVRRGVAELEPGYHTMAGLEGLCVARLAMRLEPASAGEWAEAGAFLERRRWQRGVRCAGSVFRNPEGQSAGRLIEHACREGREIGGARIMERHSNFIEAMAGARASDVVALMRRAATAVRDAGGPLLSREVRLLGWRQG